MTPSVVLEGLFQRCFTQRYQTLLVGGAWEPEYQPAETAPDHHLVLYRQDYFASALHEVAHWCLAGEERRVLHDYGYWYAADGRNPEQQKAFERVEVKPQAVELHFAAATGTRFRVSLDNLGAAEADDSAFAHDVREQALVYASEGLPERAALFCDALVDYYGGLRGEAIFISGVQAVNS
jgi:elongation factor P hydroxylase